MLSQTSNRLYQLRKERGLRQKEASLALDISQSLLSHYERGIRECGLSFLVKAADYYGVSADYLLGRTMEKNPGAPEKEELSLGESKQLRGGSISAALTKKLLPNSVTLLFDLIDRCDIKELSQGCAEMINIQIYKIFYYLYNSTGAPDGFLTIPKAQLDLLNCRMFKSEMMIRNMIEKSRWVGAKHNIIDEGRLPSLTHDGLISAYPSLGSSFLNTLSQAENAFKKEL